MMSSGMTASGPPMMPLMPPIHPGSCVHPMMSHHRTMETSSPGNMDTYWGNMWEANNPHMCGNGPPNQIMSDGSELMEAYPFSPTSGKESFWRLNFIFNTLVIKFLIK